MLLRLPRQSSVVIISKEEFVISEKSIIITFIFKFVVLQMNRGANRTV